MNPWDNTCNCCPGSGARDDGEGGQDHVRAPPAAPHARPDLPQQAQARQGSEEEKLRFLDLNILSGNSQETVS